MADMSKMVERLYECPSAKRPGGETGEEIIKVLGLTGLTEYKTGISSKNVITGSDRGVPMRNGYPLREDMICC